MEKPGSIRTKYDQKVNFRGICREIVCKIQANMIFGEISSKVCFDTPTDEL